MGKLPYIKDKRLYAAVMGACSYIRDTGWFNKATQYYADKYDVDVDEVRKYVRIAQGKGQKVANNKKPKRKYSFFAVEYTVDIDHFDYDKAEYERSFKYIVKRGISAETVKRSITKYDKIYDPYAPCHTVWKIEAFDTKEEAEKTIEKWKKEREEVCKRFVT